MCLHNRRPGTVWLAMGVCPPDNQSMPGTCINTSIRSCRNLSAILHTAILQLSMKAAFPLATILATASCRSSDTTATSCCSRTMIQTTLSPFSDHSTEANVAKNMMTSSNGNIFRVTGPLSGEFTGHRWIPHTKASDAELWWSLDLRLNQQLDKQWIHRWLETSSRSLWRHCNEQWLCNGPRYIHILITTAFFAYELGWYYYKICWDVCST